MLLRRFFFVIAALFLFCLGGYVTFLLLHKPPVPEVAEEAPAEVRETIGRSVEGRVIEAYTFGAGEEHVVFVGGIHGGYEWNSTVLAYTAIDYLRVNTAALPENLKVTIIPSANPDGLYKIVGTEGRFRVADVPAGDQSAGRFNAHGVDLNRNFDCKWQSEAVWRGTPVSAGSAAFSEPEARAIRDFVVQHRPTAVIFWHSQANAVYASECLGGVLPETFAITNAYAQAAGYPAITAFDAYEVTGDAEGWLASIGIPAITVELATHEAVEWEKNLAGMKALFARYGQSATSPSVPE